MKKISLLLLLFFSAFTFAQKNVIEEKGVTSIITSEGTRITFFVDLSNPKLGDKKGTYVPPMSFDEFTVQLALVSQSKTKEVAELGNGVLLARSNDKGDFYFAKKFDGEYFMSKDLTITEGFKLIYHDKLFQQ